MARPPKKRGPKPLHDDDSLVEALLGALRVGMLEIEAAEIAGIHPETLRRWKNKSEMGGAIKKAILEGKRHHLEKIHAGRSGWQSSAWFLERKYRAEFGRDIVPPPQEAVTVTFEDGDEK